MEQKKVATSELERLRGTMVEQATGQLDATRRELAQEQKARMEAEAKTKEALAKLAGMQQKEDDRGLVLTLSGSVLFASGKSELLPSARTRLNEVASAIKSDDRSVVIYGHTDSQGSDTFNQQLSQRRADAVRQYLISQGMPADRIRAEGIGEAQPIADNGTAEGRANNRRVEIVLQKNDAARSGTPSSTGNTRPPTGGTP
jgi:outer membrane protein OmpA-like peptidoglycan-associated protein